MNPRFFFSLSPLAAALFFCLAPRCARAATATAPTDPTFGTPKQFTTGGTSVVRVVASRKVAVLDNSNNDTGADKRVTLDFDMDGNADVVQADFDSKLIRIRLGQGSATFNSVDLNTTDSPQDVAVADLNGDGLPDIVAVAGGKVVVYLNTTNANPVNPTHMLTFAAAVTLTAQDASSNNIALSSVALADLDGDGLPEIIAGATSGDGSTNPFQAQVAVFSNTTATPGTFGAATVYTGSGGAEFIAAADMNGDGKADVITGSSAAKSFTVFLNKGTGALSTSSDTTPPTKTAVFDAVAVRGMAVGDIDADGKRDVLIYHKDNFSTSTHTELGIEGFQNDGTGTNFNRLGTAKLSTAENGTTPAGDVTLADLNGDNQPEIVIADAIQGGVSVILVNAALTHSNHLLTLNNPLFFPTDSGARRLDVGDINKDGALDLFVANSGTNNATLLLNTTGGGSSSSGGLTIDGKVSSNSDPAAGAIVRAGDMLTYTFTVKNNSSTQAKSLEIRDRLPVYVGPDGIHHQVTLIRRLNGGAVVTELDTNKKPVLGEDGKPLRDIRWKIPSLDPGAEKTVSLQAKVTTAFQINGLVANAFYSVASTIGQPPTGADGATNPLRSTVMPTYSLTGTVDPASTAAPGQIITYTLHFANVSQVMMTRVKILDAIPNGTFFVSADSNVGANVATSLAGNDFQNTPTSVMWTLSKVKPGQSVTLTLAVAAKLDVGVTTPFEVANFNVSGAFALSGSAIKVTGFDDTASAPAQVNVTGAPVDVPPKLDLAKTVDPDDATDDAAVASGPNNEKQFTVLAPAITPGQNSDIVFKLTFRNSSGNGGTRATGVYVKDRIPEGTTYVPNSATIQINGQRKQHDKAFLIDGGKTLVLPLPDLDPQPQAETFATYRVRLNRSITEANSPLHSVGAVIGAENLSGTPESVPKDVAIAVVGKPAFSIESHRLTTGVNVSGTAAGLQFQSYQIFYKNVGSGTAKKVVLKDSVPAGMRFLRAALLNSDPLGQPDGERKPSKAKGEAIVTPQIGASGDVFFALGTLQPGASGWAFLVVYETGDALSDKTEPIINNPQIGADEPDIQTLSTTTTQTAQATRRRTVSAPAPSFVPQAGDFDNRTQKLESNIAQPFLYIPAAQAIPQGGTLKYECICGNLSDVDAAPATLLIPLPTHTAYTGTTTAIVDTQFTVSTGNGEQAGAVGFIRVDFDKIPKHDVETFIVELSVDPNFVSDSIRFDHGPIELGFVNGNAAPVAASPSAYVFPYSGNGDDASLDAAFAAVRQKIGLAAISELGADTTEALQDATFTSRLDQLTRNSVHHIVSGADYLVVDNGAVVIPMRNNIVLVAGPDNVISNDGGSVVSHDGGTLIATGGGNLIRLDVPAGFGNLTAANVLVQAAKVVASGGGNLLNAGALNLIGQDGAGLVDNTVASLIGQDGAGLIGQDGAGLIGQDGAGLKSITAGEANDKINAEIIGDEQSGLVTDQGAGFTIGAAKTGFLLNAAGGIADKNVGKGTGTAGGVISSLANSAAFSLTAGGHLVSERGNGLLSEGGSQ